MFGGGSGLRDILGGRNPRTGYEPNADIAESAVLRGEVEVALRQEAQALNVRAESAEELLAEIRTSRGRSLISEHGRFILALSELSNPDSGRVSELALREQAESRLATTETLLVEQARAECSEMARQVVSLRGELAAEEAQHRAMQDASMATPLSTPPRTRARETDHDTLRAELAQQSTQLQSVTAVTNLLATELAEERAVNQRLEETERAVNQRLEETERAANQRLERAMGSTDQNQDTHAMLRRAAEIQLRHQEVLAQQEAERVARDAEHC